jgi:hypothetical protein
MSTFEYMAKKKEPTQVNARIDKRIYDQLAEYSEITGTPVSRCIAEACERWLTYVAPARIEALRAEKRKDALEKDLNLRHAKDRELGHVVGGKK